MSQDRIGMLLKQRAWTWENEDWFPTLSAAVEGVGPKEASWQPPGGGNTIWQTVNHLNYYNAGILRRLTGQKPGDGLPTNAATFGEPGNPEDATGWQAALERTRQIADGLRKALAELTDADLDKPHAKGALGDVLPSWVMHDAHHAGQIVLIRKQQGSWPAQRG